MPCLSLNYQPAVGPLIQLAIVAPGVQLQQQGVGSAPINLTHYVALIDTGASCTSISAKVISDLSLTPIGKQPVGGIHGHQPTNVYQFQVAILFPQGQLASGVMNAQISVHAVTGAEFVPPSPGVFDVLLGRDVICRGSLSLSFDGHAIICL